MPISEVYNEDCMIGMARYPDKFFELAIVDPPYGINIAEWDSKNDRPKQEYWDELFRISVNQIVFGANFFTNYLPITRAWIVWDKTIRGKSYLVNRSDFELIWSSFDSVSRIFNYTIDGNVEGWDGGRPDYNKKKAIHPTQKPVRVYDFLLKTYAHPGDKILDTHLGSQSSRIAAYDGGFDFYGWELDPDYFRDGCKRFENHIKQLVLFK